MGAASHRARSASVSVAQVDDLSRTPAGGYLSGEQTAAEHRVADFFAKTPSSGSGFQQTFTAEYSDANGAADFKELHILINTSVNAANAAYLRYLPGSNRVYLRNDANTSWS
mgnify:CR=1 FL=1